MTIKKKQLKYLGCIIRKDGLENSALTRHSEQSRTKTKRFSKRTKVT